MSIPVTIRNPDGTSWNARIAYRWSSVRENRLMLNFDECQILSMGDAYMKYGVCPALRLPQTFSFSLGEVEPVYGFLYGHTLEELMEVQEETYSMPGKYVYEPQKWTEQMVASMNWDSFCLAYYTFLCSKNDFKTEAWEVLGYILNQLKNSPEILSSLVSKAGKKSDFDSCSKFWETVYDGLQARVLDYLHEETCYTAFHALTSVRTLFSLERYKPLGKECIEFLDKIARKRIDEACQETYTVKELLNFDIELLFFYKDFFAVSHLTDKTEQYVTEAVFTLLCTKGDKIFKAGDILGADAVYKLALEYAQTPTDREWVINRRNSISSAVSIAKTEHEKVEREQEKKYKKEHWKDDVPEYLAKVFAVVLILSFISTILFGIFTLLGAFKQISKLIFIVSLGAVVALLIVLAFVALKANRK